MRQKEQALDLKHRVITTKRLVLRPWHEEISDAEAMFEYAKDPRVGPYAGWRVHQSVNDSMTAIRKFKADRSTYTWAITLKGEDRPIGSIGLHNRTPRRSLFRRDEREIGFVLNPEYWGNAYVPEAVNALLKLSFYELGLDAVWCGHYEFNKNSRRAIEKCGFDPVFKREEIMFHQNNELVWAYYYRWTRKDFLRFFGDFDGEQQK
ncbi:MAG: GNAT family N-acetyltransferase [Clostridia bacterium]|nr:GNAT family N-acetyltransferase [Clostridia bacterium]